MNKLAIRLLTLAMFTMALVVVPLLTPAHASGDENPSPPASSGTKKGKKDKSSSLEDGRFVGWLSYPDVLTAQDAVVDSPPSTIVCVVGCFRWYKRN